MASLAIHYPATARQAADNSKKRAGVPVAARRRSR
jgi:hypothetical protein